LENSPAKGPARQGHVTTPQPPHTDLAPGSATTRALTSVGAAPEPAAVLAAHLFAHGDREIPGLSYAVGYRLADGQTGGDIVDVYRFDNDAVALSIADISGKGVQAAIHAALIKYGLRAYSSHGLTPEKAMRAMDRLYLENCNFEDVESFATVFLGVVDPKRRMLQYASAGHEPVLVVHPHVEPQVLDPTAPLIGVFDDQHHLFRQECIDLWPGSLLVATTDGITEARDGAGRLFGMEGLTQAVSDHRDADPATILDAILDAAGTFCGQRWRDDVALLVARFA
jgi:sigma-B regulation protein RsbU (phosphoserine phosphatase)